MTARYIFNTDGQYVAFVQGDNLFSPDVEWLGFVRNGVDVYEKNGTFMGQLLNDDRIAKNMAIGKIPVIPPIPPLTPFRPFAPFPRLRMPSLPWGWKDVFENGPKGPLSRLYVTKFEQLLGSQLIAGNGTFLGIVSKDKFDSNSLGNRFGNYGNRYSASSIFNPFSQYGNKYGPYSPFNAYSTSPPTFLKNGRELGRLSVNSMVVNRIDPEQFFRWFEGA